MISKEREIVVKWPDRLNSSFETLVTGYVIQLIKYVCRSCLHLNSNEWLLVLLGSLCGEWNEMGSTKGLYSIAIKRVSCITPEKCWLCQHWSLGSLAQSWISSIKNVYIGMLNSTGEIYRQYLF